MLKHKTVTCVIKYKGRLLLLKRASKVAVNPNLWSAVTGRIEGNHSSLTAAFHEIYEETGLTRRKVRLIKRGRPYKIGADRGVQSLIRPYLFESKTRSIKLNWEHTKFRWIKPSEITRFNLIPKFERTMRALDLD